MKLEELLVCIPPHQIVRLRICGCDTEPKEDEAWRLMKPVQCRHERVRCIYTQDGALTVDIGMMLGKRKEDGRCRGKE